MQYILVDELLLGVTVALVSHWLWQIRDIFQFAYKFPKTIWKMPFLRCFLRIGRKNELLYVLREQWKKYEDKTFFSLLVMTPFVFTVDPGVIKQILTQTAFIEKSRTIYDPIKDGVGGGLLASRAEKSLRHRKMLSSALRPKQLMRFMDTFNSKGKEFVNKMNKMYEAGGEANNLLDALRLNAINITRVTTMGSIEVSSEYKGGLKKLGKHLKFGLRYIFFEIILNCIYLRWIIQNNSIFSRSKKKLSDITDKTIVHRTKTLYSETGELKPEKNLVIDLAYKYVLTGDMQYDEFVAEINELLLASYETTAITLYSTMVLLAMHPNIQERLYEELLSIFPNKDVHVEFEHLGQLVYLEMIINEALRLFPPVPLIGREVLQETLLEINNKWYKLPKNMQILIDIIGLHRDPNIWGPNAENFDPDNFLPHNVANRSPYAFIPFSKGARTCFGYSYAYIVLKVILVHVLRNYRLSTKFKYENIEVKMNVFLQYKYEPLLNIYHRL